MNAMQKKLLNEALSQNNQTEVWHQVALFLGRKPQRKEVYEFIENFASKKNSSSAYRFAYNAFNKERLNAEMQTACFKKQANQADKQREREIALKMVRRLFEEPFTSYSKVPMRGHEELLFCSPFYGFKDYNKVHTCKISGNEKFVNKIIGICKKFA